MRDIIETKEDCAEQQYAEMEQPDGRLKCFCGELFAPEDGDVLSPDPWAMPSCPKCSAEFFKRNKI